MKLVQTGTYEARLFPVDEDRKRDGGPILTGNVTLDDQAKTKLNFAAFIKNSAKGDFYSLVVGDKPAEGAVDNRIYGALFTVENKSSEKAPDYTGVLDLDKEGTVQLRVAAWRQSAKKVGGKDYLSIKIEPQRAKQAAAA